MSTTPYYSADGITLYCGDCREVPSVLSAGVLVMDPPYGIGYTSCRPRLEGNARSIAGDTDTSLRDYWLSIWADVPTLCFGSWRIPRPAGTRAVLIWDKGGALGMGDLSLPWKLDHEEIYVIGRGWQGRRDSGSVLRVPPEQSMGRYHPHQKPIGLMERLIAKCPPGPIIDPFAGSGSTLVAAKRLGREAIGIESDERYCAIAARRLDQRVLVLTP